jgi:hypothetical protein
MLDSILYNVFPNFSGLGRYKAYASLSLATLTVPMWTVRLWRSINWIGCPKGQPRPKPAALRTLLAHQKWSEAEELGGLGLIADQDMGNLPYVQEGLKASGSRQVQFANYQDMRIRQHHIMIQRYIDREV